MTKEMRWNKLNRVGFTILEVLVAILIIAFGLLALMRALSGGLVGSKKGYDITVATLLAQEKLEELRYSSWDSLASSGSRTCFPSPNENFQWEITVDTIDPSPYLKEVSLSIWWPAGASSQRCVNFKTYMAKYN